MSHFTRIKTQMVEKEYLKLALKELGYAYEEGEVKIRGFGFSRTKVDIKISTKGHDIGFRKAGNAYDIVADWWGVRGIKKKQFQQQVTQHYAYHAARAKLEEQGFDLVNETVDQNGQIHLVLRRMA